MPKYNKGSNKTSEDLRRSSSSSGTQGPTEACEHDRASRAEYDEESQDDDGEEDNTRDTDNLSVGKINTKKESLNLIKNDILYITPLKALEDYFNWATEMRLILEQESFKNIIDYEDRFLDSDELFINKFILQKTVLYGPPNINKPMHPFIENIKYMIGEKYQSIYFMRHLSEIRYTGNAHETIAQTNIILHLNEKVKDYINPEVISIGPKEIALQLATTTSVRFNLVRAKLTSLHRNSFGKSIDIEEIEKILLDRDPYHEEQPALAMIQPVGINPKASQNIGNKRPKSKRSWYNKKLTGSSQNLKGMNKKPYKCWFCHRNYYKGHKCKENPKYTQCH